ncbi:MAG: hypothetical protein HRT66_01150 [Flavobacteriaceae bacterium]|nr:hypothetical protein [Flavobacteriaceae bacterium]
MKTILYTLILVSTLNLYSQEFFFGKIKNVVPEERQKVSLDGTVWKVDDNGTHTGIWKIEDLEGINYDLTDLYVLMNSLDFKKNKDYRDSSNMNIFTLGEGWDPIGDNLSRFTGEFIGNNKTISNLYINRTSEDCIGLFASTAGSDIKNIGILNCNVTGNNNVGSLVGCNLDGSVIENSYIDEGTITGNKNVGGLVGDNENSTIRNSYTSISVEGNNSVGGFIGRNGHSVINNSYAIGITIGITIGNNTIGGLIGFNHTGSTIESSYATGTAGAGDTVGGLVGSSMGNTATIKNSITFSDNISGRDVQWANRFYRVVGSSSSTLINNYANVDMIVNSNKISSTDDGSFDGANMALSQMSDETFFTTPGNWDTNVWDFSIWEIKLGAVRPTLIGVGDDDGTLIRGIPEKGHKVSLYNNVWVVDSGGTHIGIWRIDDLKSIKNNLADSYVMMNDLDFNKSEDYRDISFKVSFTSGEGWDPIGGKSNGFRGSFEGNNKTISNLYINRPDQDNVGLFGYVLDYSDSKRIENIGLLSCNITGYDKVGGLAGETTLRPIKNSYSTGNVTGNYYVGGLVGRNYRSPINNSYSKCNITGTIHIGGLVGLLYHSTMSNSYAVGYVVSNVSGGAGGLVGWNYYSTIENSYATGGVIGNRRAGGLVGWDKDSTIENSIAFNDNINGSNNQTNRVEGLNEEGTLANNYANENMNINSSTRSNTDRNHKDGADLTSDNMKTQGFFTDSNNWEKTWSFLINWEIKTGAVRPTLRGVGDDDGTLMREIH